MKKSIQKQGVYRPGGKTSAKQCNSDISIAEYSLETIIGLALTICIEDPDYETNKDENRKLQKCFRRRYICNLDVFYIKEGK